MNDSSESDNLDTALEHIEALEQELAHVVAEEDDDSVVSDEAARALTGLVAARHALTAHYDDSEESS